jgi:hypothetical protein
VVQTIIEEEEVMEVKDVILRFCSLVINSYFVTSYKVILPGSK